MWTLPSNSKQPLYQQLIQLIEQAIQNDLLAPGEKLPSERQLSIMLNINRSTVIRAFNELYDRNIIIRKRGSGTFVNPRKKNQSHSLIQWHLIKSNPTLLPSQDYQRYTDQLIKKALNENKTILNMATGDLGQSLLPNINMTDIAWQELLSLEQDHETSSLGLYSFRKTIQHHLKSRGINAGIDEILVTSGTQQALFLLTHTLLNPGDRIGVELPSSFYRLPIFYHSNLKIYPLPLKQDGLDFETFKTILYKHLLKMIFINPMFQNPTGSIMKASVRNELVGICSSYQLPIIEDDSCSLLSFSSTLDVTPMKANDQHQQIIYVGSLSKYMGRNIRAGWIVAPPHIIQQLAKTRQYVDGGLSILPQMLANYYMTYQMNDHCAYLKQHLRYKLKELIYWLENNYSNIFNYNYPKGGLYLYAKFNSSNHKFIQQFCYQWMKQSIFIAQGTEFGGSKDTIRFNFSQFDHHLSQTLLT